jgi:hypothetical protein
MPPFVADCQRAIIERFDASRDPEAVCHTLAGWIARLERGAIDPERLRVRQRFTYAANVCFDILMVYYIAVGMRNEWVSRSNK